ncbi:outer membrane protein assembly factor BamB family protein [Haloarcula argentinensis]|uniref:PQQ-binding-like beta-propeller repeat protein n=1 Tax=Haloarcula argentinensis TaxID=43776 RepID=A0A830FHA2_HALAR|nr:PQQ-binding-like beta-propeller repeat protein [Haloarcula argentinensis]EMA26747.1 cell surface protein/ lipoprotein [Haloarcula argentinensis DSM 12282]MDS0255841.1 PQQ-binding-like beta-propeller repeat protein [Haloarcula argentinensis]GGM49924.1 hypothetical protein GCM10009006_34010 [Haloarcula argentinensis]
MLTTVTVSGLSALAGCSETGTVIDDGPEPEPDEPPEPLRDGVDVDALRDRTVRALGEEAFSVEGSVSYFEDGTVQESQAGSGRGDPEGEIARYIAGSSRETELEDPANGDVVSEQFYNDNEVYRRQIREGDVNFGRDKTDYGAFVDQVKRDLRSFHEVGTSFEFGDPEWDEDRGSYVVEGIGLKEELEADVEIETCQLQVNSDGIVVGVSATLSVEGSEQIRAVVDGETDPGITVEEPAWLDEIDANLPLWSVQVGGDPSTTVQDETVLVSSDEVIALSRNNGSPRWRFSIDWKDDTLTNTSSHTVRGETVFVGTNENDVYALNLKDGSERWSNTVDTRLPHPTVVDDIVVFAGLGRVYAFFTDDGSAAWTWSPDQSAYNRMFHDETLFIGDTNGVVTAIDVTTGSERWHIDAPTRNWISPSVVSQNRLYAGSFQGSVYGFDADDGTIEWQYSTDTTTVSITHRDGTVYVGDRSGKVYALKDVDGAEQWTFDTSAAARVHPGSESIYVGSHDGSIYRLSAESGDPHWKFETNGWVEQPAITDSGIYVGSKDSNLYAIERETGEKRWQREVGFWARYRPTVRDGVVYATDLGRSRGTVYAFATHPDRD